MGTWTLWVRVDEIVIKRLTRLYGRNLDSDKPEP